MNRNLFNILAVLIVISICSISGSVAHASSTGKFQSKEAKAYIGLRFVDFCSRHYMSRYNTTTLAPEIMAGFEQHARESCDCLYARLQSVMSVEDLADMSKFTSMPMEELATEDKDLDYFLDVQKRFFYYYNDAGYAAQCGIQTPENRQ